MSMRLAFPGIWAPALSNVPVPIGAWTKEVTVGPFPRDIPIEVRDQTGVVTVKLEKKGIILSSAANPFLGVDFKPLFCLKPAYRPDLDLGPLAFFPDRCYGPGQARFQVHGRAGNSLFECPIQTLGSSGKYFQHGRLVGENPDTRVGEEKIGGQAAKEETRRHPFQLFRPRARAENS